MSLNLILNERDFLCRNNYVIACELYYLKDLTSGNKYFKNITWNKLLTLSIHFLKRLKYNDRKDIKNICVSIYKYLTHELNIILNAKFYKLINDQYLEWIKLINFNYDYNLFIKNIIIFKKRYVDKEFTKVNPENVIKTPQPPISIRQKPSQIISYDTNNPKTTLNIEIYETMLIKIINEAKMTRYSQE